VQVAKGATDKGAGPAPKVYPLDPEGRTPQALRSALAEGERTGGLPPPPEVRLAVRLRNDGPGKLRVQVGGPGFVLWLDLRGPGAVTVPAVGPGQLPVQEHTALVPPGAEWVLPWGRLVSWSGQSARYSYWTEPGVYRLRARLRARAVRELPGGRERAELLTVTSAPVEVRVAR
jgi:hypothetical protein